MVVATQLVCDTSFNTLASAVTRMLLALAPLFFFLGYKLRRDKSFAACLAETTVNSPVFIKVSIHS